MLPDQFIPINTWVDLYAKTGIPSGTPLKVTNKTQFPTYGWEGNEPPPSVPDSQHGDPLLYGEPYGNTDLSVGFWVMSYSPSQSSRQAGRLCVQERTE